MRRRQLTLLSLLLAVTGCEDPATGISESSAPPVEAVAPAEDEVMTPSRLRELLGDERVFIQSEGGVIKRVSLYGTKIDDISPLAGLELEMLELSGCPIDDVSVLKGMPLEDLKLRETNVTDLSPLADMPLKYLDLIDTPVTDVSVVKTLDLEILWLRGSRVDDLTPLAGQKLKSLDVQDTEIDNVAVAPRIEGLERLNIVGTNVTDLTPLEGLPLTRLLFTPSKIEKGIDVVRAMKPPREGVLKELDVMFREAGGRPTMMGPEQFWLLYDSGAFDEKPAEEPRGED